MGGRRLGQVAEELGVRLEVLDGATERRLAGDLNEVLADPLFDGIRLKPQAIDGVIGSYPGWAQAMVTLHRAFLDRSKAMHALADRLTQDPFLGDAIHRIHTNVPAIRQISELPPSVDGADAHQQRRTPAPLSADNDRP